MDKGLIVAALFVVMMLSNLVAMHTGVTAPVISTPQTQNTPTIEDSTAGDVFSAIKDFANGVFAVMRYVINFVGSFVQIIAGTANVPDWLQFMTLGIAFTFAIFLFLFLRGN